MPRRGENEGAGEQTISAVAAFDFLRHGVHFVHCLPDPSQFAAPTCLQLFPRLFMLFLAFLGCFPSLEFIMFSAVNIASGPSSRIVN